MNPHPISFEIVDVRGRAHALQATNIEGRGWLLEASIDGRAFTHRCRDWQAVERTIRQLRARPVERRPTDAPVAGLTRALVAGVLFAVSTLLASSLVFAQPHVSDDADGVLRFVRAAEDYALLHRRLEQTVPPVQGSANPDAIGRTIDALAAIIRAERRLSQQGDLFQPAAQVTILARIAAALRARGFTAQDVLRAERAEGVDPDAIALHVNDRFPWAVSTAMFTCILEALPPLPAELMYRVVGRDLVLIDNHADLIVDILPAAIGDADSRACCSAARREVRCDHRHR